MADFSNNVGSNIVFNAEAFAGVKVNTIEVGYHIRTEGKFVVKGKDDIEYVITQINQSSK